MPISIVGDGSITGITSGGLPDGTVTNADLATGIDATKLTGTLADARFPATLPAVSGASLTALPAGNLTGALPAISGASLTGVGVDGIVSASSSGTAINIASDNDVGVRGAPDANTTLQVNSGSGEKGLHLKQTGNSGGAFAKFVRVSSGDTSNGHWELHHESKKLVFKTNVSGGSISSPTLTAALTLDDRGFVGVGISPDSPFHIAGASSTADGAPSFTMNSYAKINTFNAADNNVIQFYNNAGSRRGYIAIDIDGSVSYNSASDYRLKEDITDITDAITRVKTLKPKRFKWTDRPETLDGFLAHEVSPVVPEAIRGEKDAMIMQKYEITPEVEEVRDDDGNIVTERVDAVMGERDVIDPQSIDMSKLVPVMCSAIQELITMNENLIARIEVLENT